MTKVTPCAGVWIEICLCRMDSVGLYVTPCAGVWIEISGASASDAGSASGLPSLPVRVCGLLYPDHPPQMHAEGVTPCAGVWIEMQFRIPKRILRTSLPVRECGLK